MKRGDLVLVQARVQSVAKDGSWIDVALPVSDPKNGRNYTNAGRRKCDDGWWTKATRVLPEAVYPNE